MANSDMNVTLHFNYEQDTASYSKVMSALDQMQKKGVETLKARNMSDTQINEYINGFTKMKNAIESSFSPDLSKIDMNYASQLKEWQEGYATVQKYTDGAKVSIDNMGNSFDTGAIKIDKYSDRLDHFKLTLTNAFRYNIVNRAIDMITNSIRGMIDYVIELDSALNSIRIITGKSSEEMLQFAAVNQESAKELGRTVTEYAQASLIFYQQGLDDSQVKGRTDAALKLANVTGQSVQEIVNQMTAIWNNFDDGSHNLEYYEDVITALGATTASSSKEIAAGLEKFAAIGDTVGLSYEYAASALATVVATTRQSEDVVGTAFKTMFARLQSLKLGETLDDGTTLTKYTQALESIGISVLDQNGNLKDMDAILDEIGAKWQTLDRNQQTALANTVGGVRQYAQFIALFDNFDFFKENVTTALESAGTVTQQNTIYMESYEAKIKQIKATLDSIKFDMFMDKDFGGILDFADSFLISLREILKGFGGFNRILTVGIGLIAKMFVPDLIMKFSNTLTKSSAQLKEMSNLNFGGKFKFMFSPNAEAQNLHSYYESWQMDIDNTSQKTALLEKVQQNFGVSTKNSLNELINNYTVANQNIDKSVQKLSQYGENIEVLQEKMYKSIDALDTSASGKEVLKNLVSQYIDSDSVKDVDTFLSKLKQIQKEYQNWDYADMDLNLIDNLDIEQIHKYALAVQNVKEKIEEMEKAQQQFLKIQKIVSLVGAAIVAFQGLYQAVNQFQEGDVWGGLSQSLSSVGSALMMIPDPSGITKIIGGSLMGASTVISVIKAQSEKAKQAAKETLDTYNETKKTYEDVLNKLDTLSSRYNELSSKSNLSLDDQKELNETLKELQQIMNEEGNYDLIAYYDEYGNAVYKTTEVINEYIEALKEKQRVELEDKKQEADEAYNKLTDTKKYDQAKEQANFYQNIIDKAKANNWGLDDINKALGTTNAYFLEGVTNSSQALTKLEEQRVKYTEEMKKYGADNKEAFEAIWEHDFNIPLEQLSFDIDDNNASLFISQITNKLKEQLDNQVIDLTDVDLKPLLNILPEIDNWDSLIKGEDVDTLNAIKEALGEESALWQIITELIDENTEALIANSEVFTNISDLNDSLNEGQEIIKSLNEAFDEFNNTGELSISTMNELNEQLSQVDGWQELMDSWNDGSLTLDEFKTKMQELFNVWIDNQPVMQNLTEATKNQTIAWLESLGVSNAVEVVESRLAAQFYNTAMAIGTEEQATINALSAIPGFVEWLNQQGVSLDEVANDTNFAEQMLIQFKNTVASGAGNLDVSGVTGNLDLVIWKAQVAINTLNQVAQRRQQQYGSLPNPDEEAGNYIPPTKIDASFPYSSGGGGSSKGGGGGGGGGGEPYEAQLTGYEKVEDELEIIENRLKRIREEEKNTDDIEEKIKLRQQESELLKDQQEKLHEINNLQRKDIADNIQKLRSNGFIIDYDPDAQEWIIHNREHLHDLNDELEKDIEQMIKDTDSLIDSTRKYSEEWREANKIIKDTEKDIQKLREQQLKEEMDSFNDKISDKLFYTAFYEGLQSGLPTLKNIYLDVINSLYEQLNKLYQKGYTDADDDVQKIWKEILKYQKEVDKIDNDLFNNQIKYIDRILDLIPEIPETYDERTELVQKKVELRNERINELMVKGTESALDEVMSLYEQNAKDIEAMYKLMIGKIKEQQDELKDAIDGVVALIDKEIDKLKEEQEAQKKINEEKEKDIELMKLKANLENARHQKTVLTYRKGEGFVWEANRKAIKDAEKAINDFNKKNEKDELQERIDSLEEYKKSWSSIPNVIEEEEKISAALLKFGTDGIKDILDMREEYQKQSLDEYKRYTQEMNALTNEMNTQLISVQDTIEEVQQRIIDFQENANNNINNNQHRIFYADENGIAPPESREGDIIITADGKGHLRTPYGYEGSNVNAESGYSSVLLENLKQLIYKPELAGKEETNQDFVNGLFEGLSDKFDFLNKAIPVTTDSVTNSTNAIVNMDKTIELLNTNMGTYTGAMIEVAKTSQELVKVSSMYTNQSEIFKNQSQDSAKDSKYYSDKSQEIYNNILNVISEGSQHHQGLEVGPVGSQAGQRAFNSNFMRIARGDLKNDEIFGLLKKGEAVFTPEQLENMVNALNYSLNSIDKLSTLNNKMFNLGQMNNINNQIPITDSPSQSINFGDINIQMYGVNDLDNFAFVLKNNVKSIFAQTLAKE